MARRFVLLSLLLAPLAAAEFRASAVKIDITPEGPQWMLGYEARQSAGVHDRIFHRIVALDDGHTRFFLVASELGAISPSFYDEICRDAGLTQRNLWWTVTHTHAAPAVGPASLMRLFKPDRFFQDANRDYTALVKKSLLDGLAKARSALEPARLGIATGTARANINRRGRNAQGRMIVRQNPDGPVDRQLALIRLEHAGGKLIALIANYAMHGTVLGGENKLISGDAPGAAAAYVEEKLGAPVLFINGAAGDVAPLYTVEPDFRHMEEFKSLLGDPILETSARMRDASSQVTLEAGETAVETPRKEGLNWPEELAAYRTPGGAVKLPVRFLTINRETAIWAAPLELFNQIAQCVRERSPFRNTFYFGYANGWLGYLPTAKGFEEGGYEPTVSPFTPRAKQDLATEVSAALNRMQPPGFIDTLVDDTNVRDVHVTTRPHNRKVVYHVPTGTWIMFHGTGAWSDHLGEPGVAKEMVAWRVSRDGVHFTAPEPAVVGNGHSSSTDALLVGDRIYISNARVGYWRQKAGVPRFIDGKPFYHPSFAKPDRPNFYAPYEVFPFTLSGGRLIAGQGVAALPGDQHVGNGSPHYGSLARDSSGYIWIAGRAPWAPGETFATWVARTTRPDDITEWGKHTVLFKSAAPGTHAPQIIALEEGRLALVLFVKHEQKTMLYLYDPATRSWGQPHIIGQGYESKRASAVLDPSTRRLHVVYTDQAGDARHRFLTAPYGEANWSPPLDRPGTLAAPKAGVTQGDDDLSLSADLSKKPAPLTLVHRGPDQHLHLRYYDGKTWSPKDVPVGTRNEALGCDEVSAVADFSHGLGFVYWCRWQDLEVRKQKEGFGQLHFTLIKDVAALFSRP